MGQSQIEGSCTFHCVQQGHRTRLDLGETHAPDYLPLVSLASPKPCVSLRAASRAYTSPSKLVSLQKMEPQLTCLGQTGPH